MTRFGVMKHLKLLEEAGLVIMRRSGREKLHFLNAVPIRLIHDRWIDKYTERQVAAHTALKAELEGGGPEQVHRIFIRAAPAAIEAAIASRGPNDPSVTLGLAELEPGRCLLTLTQAPPDAGTDWAYVLSDLKRSSRRDGARGLTLPPAPALQAEATFKPSI